MPPKACLLYQAFIAGIDREIELSVGTSIYLWVQNYNCGSENGNISAQVVCAELGVNKFEFRDLKAGNTSDRVTADAGVEFKMPAKIVNVAYYGQHWDWGTSRWIQDFYHWVRLKPKAEACNQEFYVYDKDTLSPISAASITVAGKQCYTATNGKCLITLDKGSAYTASVSKYGYDRESDKSFTACAGTVSFWLKKVIETCYQEFQVYHQDGTKASYAHIVGDGNFGRAITDVNGYKSWPVTKDTTYTVYAEKEGYINSDSYTFKACTSKITLTLKVPPPPKACLLYQAFTAGVDREIELSVGDSIYLWIQNYNCGSENGNISAQVVCAELGVNKFEFRALKAGNTSDRVTADAGVEFKMPAKIVNVAYYGHHWDLGTSKWIQDFYHWIKLKPKAVVCDHEFYVYDKDTLSPISSASITVTNGIAAKQCFTGTNGKCLITLDKGSAYTASVSKYGYDRESDKSFTACAGTVSFWLKKVIETCYQEFQVYHQDGTKASYAHIVGDGNFGRAITDVNGYKSWPVTKDTTYTVYAEKEGYINSDSYTFKACKEKMTFYIKPKEEAPIPGGNYDIICKVSHCLWGFNWLAANFTSHVLPVMVSVLNKLGISGLKVYPEYSYYDSGTKEIIINADIPTGSPIPEWIITLIKRTLQFGLLLALGLFILSLFFRKRVPEPPLATRITPVDENNQYITEPVTITLSTGDKPKATNPAGGVYSVTFELERGTVFNIEDAVAAHYGATDVVKNTPHEAGESILIILKPRSIEDLVDVTVIVGDELGVPIKDAYVTLSDSYGKVVKFGVTDASGRVVIKSVERKDYSVTADAAVDSEHARGIAFIDARVETEVTVVISSKIRLTKTVYSTGEPLAGIEGVTVELIADEEVIASGTTNKNGWIQLLVDKVHMGRSTHQRIQKTGYNDDQAQEGDDFVLTGDDNLIDLIEKTGDISEVTIQPLDEKKNIFPGGALVTLEGYETKTTSLEGVVTYSDVPYGDYTVTVVVDKYVQQEQDYKAGSVPSRVYRIDEQKEYFQPQMNAEFVPNPIVIECNVMDEEGNPVPDALVDVDVKGLLFYTDYQITTGEIDVGTLSNIVFDKDDGANVLTDMNGYCKFHLPPGAIYRVRAGKPSWYNEKGKEAWTDFFEITASPEAPLQFVLYKKPVTKLTKLLIYGGAAAGLYIGGTIAGQYKKPLGTGLKVVAILPAGLAVYEGAKIVKEKIPFV